MIFSDFHHESLFYSLQLLFEDRLGYEIARPIGMEWFRQGYWKLNNLEETARQYLEVGSIPADGTPPLNNPFGIYLKDNHHHTEQRGVTLEEFKKLDIEIVIASLPQHVDPFRRLAQEKGAKFIFQMGNMFNEIPDMIKGGQIQNLLASTIPLNEAESINHVYYHQEFPLSVFSPDLSLPQKRITSFINVYPQNGGYVDYASLKVMMPDFEFRSYGGQCDDGGIVGIENIASTMKRSMWGFHSKAMGDGYGHVLYNWFAVGRPVITRISDYKGKLGEELLVDMETCIDLDLHSYPEVVSIISNMPSYKYQHMCSQAYQRFSEKVDFDAEEVKIKKFLEGLI